MFTAVQIIKDTSNRIGDIVDDGKAKPQKRDFPYLGNL